MMAPVLHGCGTISAAPFEYGELLFLPCQPHWVQEQRWERRENCGSVQTLGPSAYRALQFTKYTVYEAHPCVTSRKPV